LGGAAIIVLALALQIWGLQTRPKGAPHKETDPGITRPRLTHPVAAVYAERVREAKVTGKVELCKGQEKRRERQQAVRAVGLTPKLIDLSAAASHPHPAGGKSDKGEGGGFGDGLHIYLELLGDGAGVKLTQDEQALVQISCGIRSDAEGRTADRACEERKVHEIHRGCGRSWKVDGRDQGCRSQAKVSAEERVDREALEQDIPVVHGVIQAEADDFVSNEITGDI